MLLSITKLQNLKAIHNGNRLRRSSSNVVVNHKTTKFESNSQHIKFYITDLLSCCQSQNYKIWKQFTTGQVAIKAKGMLLSITKLQNLKAIHNERWRGANRESVVVNHKTTKFESNSQRVEGRLVITKGCCQSQNYKIWKQFTTASPIAISPMLLLSITKLQNLKAIHNSLISYQLVVEVVVNHKTTKFESNSQLGGGAVFWAKKLLSITKLQNLKAIHNGGVEFVYFYTVVVNHKTTKFESNSQQNAQAKPRYRSCCQSQNYKIWKQFTTLIASKAFKGMLLSITKLQNLKAIHNGLNTE